jgi:hypothetical protein
MGVAIKKLFVWVFLNLYNGGQANSIFTTRMTGLADRLNYNN